MDYFSVNSAEEKKDGQVSVDEQLRETGSVITKGKGGMIHTLTVIGQIEGHGILPDSQKATKYDHLLPLLVSLEEDESIDGILILCGKIDKDANGNPLTD